MAMESWSNESPSRRAFLKRAAALGALGTAAPLAMNLAAFGEAAAFTATDYKALVCVFLYGGNDYANTVIPYDNANYDLYNRIRIGGANRTNGGIAYGQSELTATALTPLTPQTLTDNIQYALNPSLTGLTSLWKTGQAAVMLNVGPLIAPLTVAQYNAGNAPSRPIPPRLFSHNDQQSTWQSGGPEGTSIGWGGRIGDLALSSNGSSLLTCISVAGNAVFLAGQNASVYRIGSSGPVAVTGLTGSSFLTASAKAALQSLVTQSSGQVLENEYNKVLARSISLQSQVSGALSSVALTTNFTPSGVSNSLSDQLKVVARLIAARNSLNVKRQVFFVSIGGFDHHDYLMRDHPPLMAKVNEAMSAFYRATVEMGIANQVTAFTASDFGRTLASNGDGSDHGWGSHHFVVGGAVRGGQFYGTAPRVSVTSDDQVGQGRLLPSTAADQYAATLARWFGVADTELTTVMPNIANFNTRTLGFMG
jgi:uncharacterized protein (DUF1501 family)